MFEVLKGCKFCQRAFLNYSQKTNLTNLCIVSSEDAIEYWSLTLYLHLIRIHNNGIFLYSVSGLSQIWWKFIRCNFFKSTLVCRIFRYFSRLRKAYKWFEKGAENENIVVSFVYWIYTCMRPMFAQSVIHLTLSVLYQPLSIHIYRMEYEANSKKSSSEDVSWNGFSHDIFHIFNVSINTNETLCYLATIMLFNVELLAFLWELVSALNCPFA